MCDLHFSKSSFLKTVFHVICWISTLILLCYWFYLFSRDEDICLVDYKKYYDTPDHTFPVLSFCLKSPFSPSKLAKQNIGVDGEPYLKYFKGEYNSTDLKNNVSKDIFLDLAKYVGQYWIQWRNGSMKTFPMVPANSKLLVPSFAGFWYSNFYICYSLQIRHDDSINAFSVEIPNKIYPNATRNRGYSALALIHHPNQLLTSGETLSYGFQQRTENTSYSMNFQIKGVERIQRRNKRSFPCNENWKNHDFDILENHARNIGCTPPYHERIIGIPVCSTKNELLASMFNLRFDDYGMHPPCQAMEKIYYNYQEPDMDGTAWYKPGHFWIGIWINNPKFKEIVQKQAIDLNGLVGYIGGYIGLILGYSILQIPDFFTLVANRYKDFSIQFN